MLKSVRDEIMLRSKDYLIAQHVTASSFPTHSSRLWSVISNLMFLF